MTGTENTPDAGPDWGALRAEARRDFRALLPIFLPTPVVLAAVAEWRGPEALWPVWGTVGAAIGVMFMIAAWACLLRGRLPVMLRRSTVSPTPAAGPGAENGKHRFPPLPRLG